MGDQAIRHVAGHLAARLRPCDRLFRWGGEEFLLLLPECSLEEGLQRAEALRRGLHGDPLPVAEAPIPITISIGLAVWRPGESSQEMLARADRALYAAKAQGRDRVVSA